MNLLDIAFDAAAIGGTIATVGDAPMYHHREQVAYGAPTVVELTDDFPAARSVRVHRCSSWGGTDICPLLDDSALTFSIYFGNPANPSTPVSVYSTNNGSGAHDLLAGSPISGYRFAPQNSAVVGGRMIVTCAVYQTSVSRFNKIAVLSAAMTDLQAGTANPWTLHYVTNEHSTGANGTGGLWCASIPQQFAGSWWITITDYDSAKTGGQVWVLNVANDGTVGQMVRLDSAGSSSNEHWHGGLILFDGSAYQAVWHVGDGTKRTLFRAISDLTEFATNATEDTSSGISGSYRVKNASSSDWDATAVASGPFLTSSTVGSNSQSQNLFTLCADPLNPAKYLKGADTDSGLIQRVALDANGIAVNEMVFNPVSNHIVQAASQTAFFLSSFIADARGDYVAALVSNEFSNGANAAQYSGVILSSDSGRSFGWIWRGTPSAGVVQNCGIAVLSDGTVLVGSVDTTSSVRVITPGARVSGKPLFFGYRPANILPDLDALASNGLFSDGSGTIVARHDGTVQKPLPAITHDQNGFACNRVTATNTGAFELINSGAPGAQIQASNLVVSGWRRKQTPTDNAEAFRVQDEGRLFLGPSAYGASGAATGPGGLDGDSDDWVRWLMMYDGSVATSTPSSLLFNLRGDALNGTTYRGEIQFEAVVVDEDRPPLPYPDPSLSGVSSGKVTGLNAGTAWTVLAVLMIPEECWDSWTADEDGTWDAPAPFLSVADAAGSNAVTFSAELTARANGGGGSSLTAATFAWQLADTDSATPTEIADHPMRTQAVIVAISKDGAGAIQYAIAGPGGTTTGERTMASAINASTIRFADPDETDALEMYALAIQADNTARTAEELATIVRTLELPQAAGGESGPAVTVLTRPFPRERSL